MIEFGYLSAFLVGLLGGVHCVGMCGGIVSALTISLNKQRSSSFQLHLAYSFGRILSYALAGAIMGGLGVMLAGFLPVQVAQHMLLALAGIFMIVISLVIIFVSLIYLVRLLRSLMESRIENTIDRFIAAINPV